MCRNIRKLRQPGRKPTEDEFEAAARQFVRKVTGYQKPSKINQAAFERAIAEIATITKGLFDELVTRE
jgi:hypothetical protein